MTRLEEIEAALTYAEVERDTWKKTAQALRAQEARISGILCDAGDDMVVEPLPEGVRALCTQRNAAREMRRCAEDALAMCQRELAAVREAWEKEREGYDETTRVLSSQKAVMLLRLEKAEAELGEARRDLMGRRAEVKSANAALKAAGGNPDNGRTLTCTRCGEKAFGVCTHIANLSEELATLKSAITEAIRDERAAREAPTELPEGAVPDRDRGTSRDPNRAWLETAAFGGSVVVPGTKPEEP